MNARLIGKVTWDDEDRDGCYYSHVWWVLGDFYEELVVIKVDGAYFVSPGIGPAGPEEDVGPFATLEEAKAVALATMRLSQ